ncbi:MAG: hypothetical protein FVQ77_15020 [Cytophagales bacterium]|nr:hypothetical protein [Cytophagales bacterium]
MEIKPIKTEADYKKALEKIEKLMDAKANTPEGDLLDVLATLVETYEKKHYPIGPPDPVEAIKFRMEQMNLRKTDVAKYFGSKSKVTEVFQRKRNLTLKMIRNLHKGLNIPLESLIAV